MNNCVFLGNLTKDVELVDVGETKVGKFGIALNRRFKKKGSDEVQEEVSFLDIEAWGRQAEVIEEYFKKGDKILVRCTAKQETWDDANTGTKRSKIKFRLDEFSFVGSADKDGTTDAGNNEEKPKAKTNKTVKKSSPPTNEEQTPF